MKNWGLGIGDWGLGPIPNPQSPIPTDLYFNVLKDRKKAVCTIKAEPVDENKKTDPAKPKTETTWDYEDLCNAFCQPMYKLRCVFTKICHPRTDNDCRDPIFRYVC
jgi:hypothetical protein